MTGPLAGLRVVELAGIGAAPFAGMLLADLGADVVRVDRPGGPALAVVPPERDVLGRGKRSVALDLKGTDDVRRVLELVARADLLLEGMRPGVAERLGVGPDACLARNPRLVYGRMTGWGQDGPDAGTAGHDITYVAVSGALGPSGPADGPPKPALNLLGDFAGAAYLVVGLLAALHESRASGVGQVVDAAMVDSTAHLTTMFHGLLAAGAWQDRPGSNLLDGGAPFYGTYRTSDGGWMAVGALRAGASTTSCWPVSASTPPTATGATRRPGRRCGNGSPTPSRPGRATSGPRRSPAATRAWHRCSGSATRPGTRTSPPAARSSSTPASCNRLRRHGSRGRRPRWTGRHRPRVSTPTRSSPSGSARAGARRR